MSPELPSSHDRLASLVDLEAVRARIQGGEELDIYQVCEASVTADVMREQALVRYPLDRDRYRRDRMEASELACKRVTGRVYVEAFSQAIEGAADTETLAWYMDRFMKSEPIEYYYDVTPKRQGVKILHAITAAELSARWLQGFTERNPGLASEGFDAWMSSVRDVTLAKNDRTLKLQYVNSADRIMASRLLSNIGPEERERRLQASNRLAKDARWQHGTIESFLDQENVRIGLASLELVDIDRLDEEKLWLLHESMLRGDVYKGRDVAKFIGQSFNATVNIASGVASKTEAVPGSPLNQIVELLQACKARGINSYGDMIRLANLALPLLKTKTELEIDPLNPAALEDYPKAVDRVLAIYMIEAMPQLEAAEALPLYEAAAECARTLAFLGVEHKLAERVLTIGDIVLRYPNLTPEQQRDMIEQLQVRRSETAAQAVYRDLRLNHKNRAFFNRDRTSYGLMG